MFTILKHQKAFRNFIFEYENMNKTDHKKHHIIISATIFLILIFSFV